MPDVTADEIARAKRCRHFLNWEEHRSGRVSVSSAVPWLLFSGSFVSADDADERFALALRPVFASIGPVVAAEERERCAKIVDDQCCCGQHAESMISSIRNMK